MTMTLPLKIKNGLFLQRLNALIYHGGEKFGKDGAPAGYGVTAGFVVVERKLALRITHILQPLIFS